MSVTLFPGIRRLHLIYSTRYDTSRTEDVRDDLLGIRIWISTVQGFNYANITPLEFGVGSSVSIEDLNSNTTYYLRYAFISKLDPSIFTVSAELSASTYDELTTVYGELTNDPYYLPRSVNSSTPNWTNATGVFKVWDINTEVTGNGPAYSIVPNSITNGLQVTIDDDTGIYVATGWTGLDTSARVTFRAIYNGITIERDWEIVNGIGQDAPQIKLIVSPDNFLYLDTNATLAENAFVQAIAELSNLTGTPTFSVRAFRSDGTEILTPQIQFTQTGNVITITNQQFHISDEIGYALIRAQIGNDIYDEDTVFRLNNGTSQITVDISNPVVQLQADPAGLVDPLEYSESGTTIEVYEGVEKLRVGLSGAVPAPGRWRIDNIVGAGITPEDQPQVGEFSITFPQHSGMTADTATVTYTVVARSNSGEIVTRTVKQSLAKNKPGNSAPIVNLTTPRLVFVKEKNSGSFDASNTTITANVINVTNPVYKWYIDNVHQVAVTGNTITVDAFTAGTSKSVKCEILKESTVLTYDELTLFSVEQGSDSLVAGFTDQNINIGANSAGVIFSGQLPFTTQLQVLRGSELVTSNVVFSRVSEVGMVSTINANTGQISVTNVTASVKATATYRAAVTTDNITTNIDRVFTINIVKDGAKGDSAVTIDLVSEADVVFAENDGTGYSFSNINNNAIRLYLGGQLLTSDVAYGYSGTNVKNGLTLSVNTSTGAITLSGTNWTSDQETFTLTATYNSVVYSAQYTIVKAKEGGTAVTVDLISEADVVAANNDGSGYTLPTGNAVQLYLGNTLLNSADGVTYSGTTTKNGLRLAISNSGSITLENNPAWTTNQESFDLVATYKGVAYTTKYTIAKSRQGAVGANAPRTAFLELYKWSATQPTTNFPSGNSTYTWSTGAYTSPQSGSPAIDSSNGWTIVPGNPIAGQTLWAISTVYVDQNTIAAQPTSIVGWGGPFTPYAVGSAGTDGINGTNGTRTAVLELYKWANTQPTSLFPSGTSTYTWSTGSFTNPSTLNSWAQTPGTPQPGQILWAVSVTYSDQLTTANSSITWPASPTAYAVGGAGANGTRTAVLDVYRYSTTAPTQFPSGTSTYNWINNTFTAPATLNGWSLTPPDPVKGQTLWIARKIISDSSTATTTENITWDVTTAIPLSYAGQDGQSVQGPAGVQGIVTRIAYRIINQQDGTPAYTASTTENAANANNPQTVPGSGWTLTAPTATVGTVIWISYGRYNPNATVHQNIQAYTTEWSAPVAVNIFQDIRSDNWLWNDTNTTAPTVSDFINNTSQQGYYIQRTTGNFFGGNVYMQGQIVAKGTSSGTGLNLSWSRFGLNGAGTESFDAGFVGLGSTGAANKVGVAGLSESKGTVWNVGVFGRGTGSGGIGVIGTGTLAGVSGQAAALNAYGIYGEGWNGTGVAGLFRGTVSITGELYVDSNISAATGVFVAAGPVQVTQGNLTLLNGSANITGNISASGTGVGIITAANGLRATTGGLIVTAGGAQINGGSLTVPNGNISAGTGITVNSGGITVTGGNVTLGAGNLSVTGNIVATGDVTAFNSSDVRYKQNIQKIQGALNKLRKLGGYTYDYTESYVNNHQQAIKLGLIKSHDIGVLAHEVQQVIPQAVAKLQDGFLGVNYVKLIPLIIEAILELDRRK